MFRNVPKFKDTSVSSPKANNSNRGGYRGRGGAFTRKPGRPRLTGVFADGIWHCDCDPRLPAEHFKVKKEGPNTGRWFYTCQASEGRKCGFFLWDDDAKPREEAAVLSNSRNEPRSTPGVYPAAAAAAAAVRSTSNKPVPLVQQSPETTQSSLNSSSTLSHAPSTNAQKRKFQDNDVDDDEDESFPWSLTGQDEIELARIDPPPETPRKAVKFDALATPATSVHRKLPWLDHSASSHAPDQAQNTTPSTTSDFTIQSTSKHSVLAQRFTATTPQVTPSPLRFHDALGHPQSPHSTLTVDVFAALDASNVSLPADLGTKLRDLFTRHELRTQGTVKGRDITRLALKARDAKIAELQAKIGTLEAEKQVDAARIQTLEWEKDMLRQGQDLDTEL